MHQGPAIGISIRGEDQVTFKAEKVPVRTPELTVLTPISRKLFGLLKSQQTPFNVSYINHLAHSYHAPWPISIAVRCT
jgi:hypothetical protein